MSTLVVPPIMAVNPPTVMGTLEDYALGLVLPWVAVAVSIWWSSR